MSAPRRSASMRLSCLFLAAAMCLSGSAVAARGGPPPVIRFQADIGEIFVSPGSLKVQVVGHYINGKLEPEVGFDLMIPNECKYEVAPTECGFRSNSNTYASVEPLIEALAEAERRLSSGGSLDREFGRPKGCCVDR